MAMITNKYIILALVALSGVLSLQFECNKKFNCAENVYGFDLGIKAYPDKDSINVGDTLWLEVNSPTTLKDFRSGSMVDYSGAENLGSFIAFSKVEGATPKWVDAANKFNYKLIYGQDVTRSHFELGHEYTFIERNKQFQFLLAIIPKEKGTFRLGFSNAANVYRQKDKCTKANFNLNFKNTNQHYYLSPFYQGGTFAGGDYYFEVY